MIEVKNGLTRVIFDGQAVTIERIQPGPGRRHTDTRIPVSGMTAVRFRAASLTGPGSIEFVAPGTADGLVTFSWWKRASFAALHHAVDAALGQH